MLFYVYFQACNFNPKKMPKHIQCFLDKWFKFRILILSFDIILYSFLHNTDSYDTELGVISFSMRLCMDLSNFQMGRRNWSQNHKMKPHNPSTGFQISFENLLPAWGPCPGFAFFFTRPSDSHLKRVSPVRLKCKIPFNPTNRTNAN